MTKSDRTNIAWKRRKVMRVHLGAVRVSVESTPIFKLVIWLADGRIGLSDPCGTSDFDFYPITKYFYYRFIHKNHEHFFSSVWNITYSLLNEKAKQSKITEMKQKKDRIYAINKFLEFINTFHLEWPNRKGSKFTQSIPVWWVKETGSVCDSMDLPYDFFSLSLGMCFCRWVIYRPLTNR